MNIDELFNDSDKLSDVLTYETPIGCVLVSVNFLEMCLVMILQGVFRKSSNTVEDLFKINGVLSDFSSKAKICYSLSLIEKQMFNDIQIIAEIRNLLAHSHVVLDFNDSEVIDKCSKLKSCEKSFPPGYLEQINDNEIPRLKFTTTVLNIINELMVTGVLNKILGPDKYKKMAQKIIVKKN